MDIVAVEADADAEPAEAVARGGDRGGKRRYFTRWVDGKRIRTTKPFINPMTRGECLARAREKGQ